MHLPFFIFYFLLLFQDGHDIPGGGAAFPVFTGGAAPPALQPADALLPLLGQAHGAPAKKQLGVSLLSYPTSFNRAFLETLTNAAYGLSKGTLILSCIHVMLQYYFDSFQVFRGTVKPPLRLLISTLTHLLVCLNITYC